MRAARKLVRTCWWCGSRLVEGSVQISRDPDGNRVQVHLNCYDETEAYARSNSLTPVDEHNLFRYYNKGD